MNISLNEDKSSELSYQPLKFSFSQQLNFRVQFHKHTSWILKGEEVNKTVDPACRVPEAKGKGTKHL